MLQFHSWYQFVTFSIQRRVIFWCFFPNDFPNLEMLFCVSPVFVTEIHRKSSGQSAFQRWFKRRDQAFHSYMKYTKKQMLSMDNPWLMKNRGFSPVIATKAGILDFIKSPWVSYLDPSWPFFLLISETSLVPPAQVLGNLTWTVCLRLLVLPRPSL